MPWKVKPMSELRLALCHAVRTHGRSVTTVSAEFGVSRKTAYKWLGVFDHAEVAPLVALADRSRRPISSPWRTSAAVERAVLKIRLQYNWGPRKIHAFLQQQAGRQSPRVELPSVRTVYSLLARNGMIGQRPVEATPPQRFERPLPNQLWQLDFKSPVQVARQKLMPFSILDDCSRYLLAFEPCMDVTMASAWHILWRTFGQVGTPEQILCDNAFNTMGTPRPVGISWFDSQLIRLGIRPIHGRAYHPQTQGKIERMHGSSMRELIRFNARRDCVEHFRTDCHRWRNLYNNLRPHEALNDQPPASRWKPSHRQRPVSLPVADSFYPAGAVLRRVHDNGIIHFNNYRIRCGKGIGRQLVRIEERETEWAVHYCWKEFRTFSHDQLNKDKIL